MRRAAARTATRRGWVTRILRGRSRWGWVSAAARAAGTSVVLPVPGGAVMTAQAPGRAAAAIRGSEAATGRSGGSDTRSSSVRTPPLSPLRPEGAGAGLRGWPGFAVGGSGRTVLLRGCAGMGRGLWRGHQSDTPAARLRLNGAEAVGGGPGCRGGRGRRDGCSGSVVFEDVVVVGESYGLFFTAQLGHVRGTDAY